MGQKHWPVDNRYMLNKNKRDAFYQECEKIAGELNRLGHKLLPLDQDMDMNFEISSITWATTGDDNPKGLDVTFYPKRTIITWSIGAYA